MRVSPVAWAYDNLDKVLMEAEKTAIVTHNHPEGVKGAVAVAHAIYYLRTTHNQKVFENIMQSYYPQFMVNDYYAGVFDETCQGTVPLCLKIIRVSTSFEDAIRRAISWGGDSDTIGAIVGSMAEALWGVPKEISDKAFDLLPTEMLNVVGDFFGNLNRKHFATSTKAKRYARSKMAISKCFGFVKNGGLSKLYPPLMPGVNSLPLF